MFFSFLSYFHPCTPFFFPVFLSLPFILSPRYQHCKFVNCEVKTSHRRGTGSTRLRLCSAHMHTALPLNLQYCARRACLAYVWRFVSWTRKVQLVFSPFHNRLDESEMKWSQSLLVMVNIQGDQQAEIKRIIFYGNDNHERYWKKKLFKYCS